MRKCLKDEDPYVRKTAAVCGAELYDIDATIVEDNGFLELLKDLLRVSYPMVVVNAVVSISEILECIQSESTDQLLAFNQDVVNKLLTALNECTEWGQIFILDAIANYQPEYDAEAQGICESFVSRLSQANAAVVLSAIKLIMKLVQVSLCKTVLIFRRMKLVFFVKYNDPIYVKLDIMIRLINHQNITQVLVELKEYAKS